MGRAARLPPAKSSRNGAENGLLLNENKNGERNRRRGEIVMNGMRLVRFLTICRKANGAVINMYLSSCSR